MNLVFRFILKNTERKGFRYFYAHQNNSLRDRSKLGCHRDDLAKLKDTINKTDVTESFRRQGMNTNWRVCKLTTSTVFTVFFKDVSMGCKDAFLPKLQPRNYTVNCFTYEENTRQTYKDNLCLFCAPSPPTHGSQRLEEETVKIFNSFLNRMDGIIRNQIKVVHMNNILVVEDLVTVKNLLYDIYRRWKHYGRIFSTKCAELRTYCATSEIQQLYMLSEQHYCSLSVFRLSWLWHFLQKNSNLERNLNLTIWSERVKNVFAKNLYQIRETLFDKLDSFGNRYTSEQKLFKL